MSDFEWKNDATRCCWNDFEDEIDHLFDKAVAENEFAAAVESEFIKNARELIDRYGEYGEHGDIIRDGKFKIDYNGLFDAALNGRLENNLDLAAFGLKLYKIPELGSVDVSNGKFVLLAWPTEAACAELAEIMPNVATDMLKHAKYETHSAIHAINFLLDEHGLPRLKAGGDFQSMRNAIADGHDALANEGEYCDEDCLNENAYRLSAEILDDLQTCKVAFGETEVSVSNAASKKPAEIIEEAFRLAYPQKEKPKTGIKP